MIYLDNASTSWPKPPCVLQEMERFLREDAGGPGRGGHRMAIAAERVIQEARVKLARLIHANDPNRIIHCLNGTDALNIAIHGSLRQDDHVICTVLDHNSVSRPLEAMTADGFISLTRAPIGDDGCVDPEVVRKSITSRTRLVTVVHAGNVTGIIQPIAEIGRIARERDCLFLVDAAQSAGVLDIDVNAMNIDLLAFPCHKSLLGPTGTGALYVGDRADLTPWREGGTGADSASKLQPMELPTRLEAGTPNTVGIAGLSVALSEVHPAESLLHERNLLDHLLCAIAEKPRIHVIAPAPTSRRVGLISLDVDGIASTDVATILDQSFGIAVRPGLHCAPYAHRTLGTFPDGTIRISPGWSNTAADIDALVGALNEIASA
ncbi:MAG: aminotransferase class V-fold PLP-dependent enzyme [Planctomycetes bacterium]|nr:aminotransferase class V-fold PLP-dependent enzyme [Planctomycetota bacterium]